MKNKSFSTFILTTASILSCLCFQVTAQKNNFESDSKKLASALQIIDLFYVDTVSNNNLVETAITNMLKDLDPHSVYLNKEEIKEANEPLQGNFEGIGVQFSIVKDTIMVVTPTPGGPSEKLGIMPGDRICHHDGEDATGSKVNNSWVFKHLRGVKGTKVKVGIKRKGKKELIEYTITRDKIPINSIDATFMATEETGYIKLNRFGATTMEEFDASLKDLKSKGMKSLILDLRGNGGGYLNTAIDLSDEFLNKEKLVVYTEGNSSPMQKYLATSAGDFEKGKLIILIDEGSASASEIVSGAIQDWDRGLIIGRRSFGKGLVQRPLPLPDGSSLKLTIARYFTPSGRFIQKPYENAEEYSRDLIDRYNRGEMSTADSIHFPDSLRTYTLVNKRTIYGGGGIMPDVFVPLDTTKFTSLHKLLTVSGIMNRYSIQYVDSHRAELTAAYPNIDEFIKNFNITDGMINEMLSLAESEKITISKEDRSSDKTLLLEQLKAYIARDLGKTADYYKVMRTDNESLNKALQILKEKNTYDVLLKRKQNYKQQSL